MVNKNPKVHFVTIIQPWWLRWAKRFVSLKYETKSLDAPIKGMKAISIITDEAGYYGKKQT